MLLKFRIWILNRAEELNRRGMKQRGLRSEGPTVKRSGGMTLVMQKICVSLGCNKVVGEQGRNSSMD